MNYDELRTWTRAEMVDWLDDRHPMRIDTRPRGRKGSIEVTLYDGRRIRAQIRIKGDTPKAVDAALRLAIMAVVEMEAL